MWQGCEAYRTVAAALYQRRQTCPALARSRRSHSMHPSPAVERSLGSKVVSCVCGATCTMIFVRTLFGSFAAKSRPGLMGLGERRGLLLLSPVLLCDFDRRCLRKPIVQERSITVMGNVSRKERVSNMACLAATRCSHGPSPGGCTWKC